MLIKACLTILTDLVLCNGAFKIVELLICFLIGFKSSNTYRAKAIIEQFGNGFNGWLLVTLGGS